ncbi:hypothetical protein ACH4TX_41790 [Streptomyces sp. NPDC021098]|uniref:hypothetical protein n=1 Tax=unclassified Streptomyces TaxID=2593676 RepID=UPI0037953CBA
MTTDQGRMLTADELGKTYGPDAAAWPALGLTVNQEPDPENKAVPTAKVLKGGEQIGYIIESDSFPGLPVFSVLITSGWPVAFPHGFIPPDPLRAREGERRRWLPPQHPDHPDRTS